ncbi:COG4223 family protein [Nioella nitratireducens]|uniref:COG4223 family protein n=1 Tax=Nioella nitratireducens TaxID=1287720 RepID=UPI0008FD2A77|nr:mitofilin family membrane protein [Nioella nitratireducens]
MPEPTKTPNDEDVTATETEQAEGRTDAPEIVAQDAIEDAEVVDDPTGDATGDDAETGQDAPAEEPHATAGPTQAPSAEPQVVRRSPGFVPLLLGGVVAAGLGYGAAYMGYLPTNGQSDPTEALASLQAADDSQAGALSTLQDRAAALEDQLAALPPVPDPVDLAPLAAQIEALGGRIDTVEGRISDLTDRVAFLETVPAGEGTGGNNTAATAAAVAQLRAALAEQQATLEAQQAQNTSLAEELRGVASAAEERISAAEARAEARVNGATAQAALGQLRIAVATGAPFASALADVTDVAGIDTPEGLAAVADTGAPSLDALQTRFPAVARTALPIAIRETAGDGAMNRVTAFLQSQVGGRSLEPQEGDSPDAILSRAEAAVATGDLTTALEEVSALPQEAQDVMADWTADAQAHIAATEGLTALAAALDTVN